MIVAVSMACCKGNLRQTTYGAGFGERAGRHPDADGLEVTGMLGAELRGGVCGAGDGVSSEEGVTN